MALELRQQLKLAQQLIMTPQLQMAIKLLQLSRLELMDTIRQELEENPALEEVIETPGEEPLGQAVEEILASVDSVQVAPAEVPAAATAEAEAGIEDNVVPFPLSARTAGVA
jgi:RNA polymerase sigma-54 factor